LLTGVILNDKIKKLIKEKKESSKYERRKKMKE
jgi:hypothetical protein